MIAHVSALDADAIEAALQAPSGPTLTFTAEDGRYTVVLGRVVYCKRFAREGRVGFGG
jgi:hypothetical protein